MAGVAALGCAVQGPARPASWAEPRTVTSIGSGDCVVLGGGQVRCEAPWLNGLVSQLGGVVSVSGSGGLAGYPRCAVTRDGRAVCWGCASAPNEYMPPAYQLLTNVTQVVVGMRRACALQSSGAIRCWGPRAGAVQPFDTSICQSWTSEQLEEAEPFPPTRRIAMTADGRMCALTAAGAVLCDGVYEPLTDPLAIAASRPLVGALGPSPTPGVKQLKMPVARDIVAGTEHFCARGENGSVTCWDENAHGQAGAPTELCVEFVYGGCKVKPTRVRLDAKATAISAGGEHSCAVLEDGGVACWGNNESGVLGFKSDQICHPNFRGFCNPVPERIPGIGDARQIAASPDRVRTWVLNGDGDLLFWPDGDRVPIDRRRPIGPCASREGTLTADQLDHAEPLLGRRVRVRGIVTAANRLGPLHLTGTSVLRAGDRVIVDGQLGRWHPGPARGHALGIHVYDACLTP